MLKKLKNKLAEDKKRREEEKLNARLDEIFNDEKHIKRVIEAGMQEQIKIINSARR